MTFCPRCGIPEYHATMQECIAATLTNASLMALASCDTEVRAAIQRAAERKKEERVCRN